MLLHYTYKFFRRLLGRIQIHIDILYCHFLMKGNNIQYREFRTSGSPYIMVARGGFCSIGPNFAMNNGIKGNPIGCYQKCTLFVDKGAELIIGNNVGISQTALIAHKKIVIGNNVKIGGGSYIYDTDFHSLHPKVRMSKDDLKNKVKKDVRIEDNVFIGAHSIILKGVSIGKNSIIGAGSVVTKSVPANEIWAGNPAKFIRKIKI